MVIKHDMELVQHIIDKAVSSKCKRICFSVSYWRVQEVLSWLRYVGFDAYATMGHETAVLIEIIKP